MPNRLRTSTSPYLRQHADNPVDWHEWGDEAFREAAERDVPVLLSVGYSACHWCHVMAHESFEDPDVAAVMNERFVNIKVDREERPDVDAVYMTAVQALTGHGGWPMTVWLDPERRPFYAGTYFPPTPRAGMASFPQVMDAITDAWHSRRNDLTHQAEQLTDAVSRQIPPGAEVPGSEDLQNAYAHFAEHHDPVHGGIGGAPKFPQQPSIDFLLRITGRPWAPKAGAMARQSLEKIAAGGIHDQVGGGFARYSVDSEWLVPHFEKMLYDNAQLARLYLRAGQVFGSTWFTTVAIRTFEYMDRDLGHPDGGFQSAEDADSDGREGAFYVWTDEDFRAATGDLADFGASRYGVTPSGNFEGENVLHISRLLSELASERDITVEEAASLDDEVRRRLMTAREGRTRPGLDDKIVTAWNGLAIGAFAEGGAVLDRDDLIDRAVRAAEFVLDRMVDDGRLQRTWAQGTARIPAFLDDHAAMALACFTLYEATSEVRWFRQAEALTRRIPELFAAPDGGFFTVGRDAEQLLVRQKDLMDNPAPSGNSLATEALLRLAAYTGDGSLVELAEQAMAAAALIVERSPSAVGHLLGAIDFDASGAVEVAIVGPEADRFTEVVWSEHRPNMVVATDRTGTDDAHVPLLESRWKDGQTLAYVCEDFECRAPTSEPAELAAQLPAVTASARS